VYLENTVREFKELWVFRKNAYIENLNFPQIEKNTSLDSSGRSASGRSANLVSPRSWIWILLFMMPAERAFGHNVLGWKILLKSGKNTLKTIVSVL